MSFSDSSSSFHSSPQGGHERESLTTATDSSTGFVMGFDGVDLERGSRAGRRLDWEEAADAVCSDSDAPAGENSVTKAPSAIEDCVSVESIDSAPPQAVPSFLTEQEVLLPQPATSPLRVSASNAVSAGCDSGCRSSSGVRFQREETSFSHLSPPQYRQGSPPSKPEALKGAEEVSTGAHSTGIGESDTHQREMHDTVPDTLRLGVSPPEDVRTGSTLSKDDGSAASLPAPLPEHALSRPLSSRSSTPETRRDVGKLHSSPAAAGEAADLLGRPERESASSVSDRSLYAGHEAMPSETSTTRGLTFLDGLVAGDEEAVLGVVSATDDVAGSPPSIAPDPSSTSLLVGAPQVYSTSGLTVLSPPREGKDEEQRQRNDTAPTMARPARESSWSPSPPRLSSPPPVPSENSPDPNLFVLPSNEPSVARPSSHRTRSVPAVTVLQLEEPTVGTGVHHGSGPLLSPLKDSPPSSSISPQRSPSSASLAPIHKKTLREEVTPDEGLSTAGRRTSRTASPRLPRGTAAAGRRVARPAPHQRTDSAASTAPSLDQVLALRPATATAAGVRDVTVSPFSSQRRQAYRMLGNDDSVARRHVSDVTGIAAKATPVRFLPWDRPDHVWTVATEDAPVKREVPRVVPSPRTHDQTSRLGVALSADTLSPAKRTLLAMSTSEWSSRNASVLQATTPPASVNASTVGSVRARERPRGNNQRGRPHQERVGNSGVSATTQPSGSLNSSSVSKVDAALQSLPSCRSAEPVSVETSLLQTRSPRRRREESCADRATAPNTDVSVPNHRAKFSRDPSSGTVCAPYEKRSSVERTRSTGSSAIVRTASTLRAVVKDDALAREATSTTPTKTGEPASPSSSLLSRYGSKHRQQHAASEDKERNDKDGKRGEASALLRTANAPRQRTGAVRPRAVQTSVSSTASPAQGAGAEHPLAQPVAPAGSSHAAGAGLHDQTPQRPLEDAGAVRKPHHVDPHAGRDRSSREQKVHPSPRHGERQIASSITVEPAAHEPAACGPVWRQEHGVSASPSRSRSQTQPPTDDGNSANLPGGPSKPPAATVPSSSPRHSSSYAESTANTHHVTPHHPPRALNEANTPLTFTTTEGGLERARQALRVASSALSRAQAPRGQ